MRTRTRICAAALAAGVLTSWAQSNVYSLNVVGYVNKQLVGSFAYNLIANPLKNANNNISNLFNYAVTGPGLHDGDEILRWDPVNFKFIDDNYSYDDGANVWK